MDTIPAPTTPDLFITLDHTTYHIKPGEVKEVNASIENTGDNDIYVEFSISGIDNDWVKSRPTVIKLPPKSRQPLKFSIQPPINCKTGSYALVVHASSQAIPAAVAEINASLLVAPVQMLEYRLGVLMDSTQFTVTPGVTLTIPILLLNQGLLEDYFRLSLDGIPTSWISTSSPVTRINPAEAKEININIHIPHTSASTAGRHPFKIVFSSDKDPATKVIISCILTLTAFTQYSCELSPKGIVAGSQAQVTVKNQGNTPDTYLISWLDPDEALLFTPEQPSLLRVSAGSTGTLPFTVRPRRFRLYGRGIAYPFTIQVRSSNNEVQEINGGVLAQGLAPVWIIPVFLILLVIGCISISLLLGSLWNDRSESAMYTESFNQTVEALITQSYSSVTPNATQTTSNPLPSNTPAPSNTLTPTSTNTFTPSPTPTALLTPTPTPTASTTNTQVPTSTSTLIPTPPTSTATPTNIPNIGQLVFSSDREGNFEIYTYNTSNGALFRLTIEPASDLHPAWSPDGSRIAFSSNRTGNYDIYIINADGTGLANLTNNSADDMYPTWSPDGTLIAFSTNRDLNIELYVMEVNGNNQQNKSNMPGSNESYPHWFMNGGQEYILFSSNLDGDQDIFRMKPDGSEVTNLTNSAGNDIDPSTSRAGDRITFTSNRTGNNEILLMNFDGSNPVLVTNNTADDTSSTWSSDSNWIIFVTNRTNNYEIFAIRPDGANPFNVTNNPADDQGANMK